MILTTGVEGNKQLLPLLFKKSRLQTGSSGHHSTDEKSNNSGGGDVHFTPLTDWNCSVGGNGSSLSEAHVLYLPGGYSYI